MSKWAFTAIYLAAIAEIAWIVTTIAKGTGWWQIVYAGLVALAFVALAATHGRYRWLVASLRIFIGLAFVSAVCDRAGLLGPPGGAGVSWGDFENFTKYTGQVNSFLPPSVIPSLAVVETAIEGTLGIAMLLGIWLRVTIWASTALLLLFGVAMTISMGLASQFPFAVFVLCSGTWALASSRGVSFISLDSLWATRNANKRSPLN